MPIERSAGAIIFRKEGDRIYYLLLRYPSESKKEYWGFPKGRIEKGEKLEQTVKREIREETGLQDIRFIGKFQEQDKYFFTRDGKKTYKIATFLLAETKTKNVIISSEHLDYKWLPYKEALEKLTYKTAKKILQKANDFLNSKTEPRNSGPKVKKRTRFSSPVKMQNNKASLKNKVYKIVKEIPRRETLTYKRIAELAGFPRAWRAVGNILNKNKDPRIPCHRVIKSDGNVGGYRYGTKKKTALLRKEKVIIKRGKIVNYK